MVRQGCEGWCQSLCPEFTCACVHVTRLSLHVFLLQGLVVRRASRMMVREGRGFKDFWSLKTPHPYPKSGPGTVLSPYYASKAS